MRLSELFWPWGEIARLKSDVSGLMDAWRAENSKVTGLQVQLAKFDHDGDGKPGGSKKRAKTLTDADVGFPECP